MPAHISDMNTVASKWLPEKATVESDIPKLFSE